MRRGEVNIVEVFAAVLDRVNRLAAYNCVGVEMRHPHVDVLPAGHQADNLRVHFAVQLVPYDARRPLGQ